jgi:hypothetical protein
MSEKLKNFLSELAVAPEKLASYLQNPDAVMKQAGLDTDECTALKSGDPAKVYASLSGQIAPGQTGASQVMPQANIIYGAPSHGTLVSATQPQPNIIYAAQPQTGIIYAAQPQANIIYAAQPQTGIIYAAQPQANIIYAAQPASQEASQQPSSQTAPPESKAAGA